MCKGAYPVWRSTAFTIAPFSNNNFTIGPKPFRHAICKGAWTGVKNVKVKKKRAESEKKQKKNINIFHNTKLWQNPKKGTKYVTSLRLWSHILDFIFYLPSPFLFDKLTSAPKLLIKVLTISMWPNSTAQFKGISGSANTVISIKKEVSIQSNHSNQSK